MKKKVHKRDDKFGWRSMGLSQTVLLSLSQLHCLSPEHCKKLRSLLSLQLWYEHRYLHLQTPWLENQIWNIVKKRKAAWHFKVYRSILKPAVPFPPEITEHLFISEYSLVQRDGNFRTLIKPYFLNRWDYILHSVSVPLPAQAQPSFFRK